MSVKHSVLILVYQLLYINNLFCQELSQKEILNKNIPPVNFIFNRIFNDNLSSFYEKLEKLKKSDSGIVRIIHIGDSHIQADYLSGIVRKGLQKYFGNAGRGIVFPYQLAVSNAPSDILSTSNITWDYNRLAHPEKAIESGVSGFCIQTGKNAAAINFQLKPVEEKEQLFKKLSFFLDDNPASKWVFKTKNSKFFFRTPGEGTDTSFMYTIKLQEPSDQFTFTLLSTDTISSFYGVSLENDQPGVLYHNIGVNGARYDQYNIAPLFWKQLAMLNADMFIISLGTNEAQKQFNEDVFKKEVTLFLEKIKAAAPGAAVIITTPADSYKGRGSNVTVKQVSSTLTQYCTDKRIALWDLYRITNGYNSARFWLQKGLMNSRDKVHFTKEGYQLQGTLLLNALILGYNNHISNR